MAKLKYIKMLMVPLLILILISSFYSYKLKKGYDDYEKSWNTEFAELREKYPEKYPNKDSPVWKEQEPYIPDTYAVFDHLIVDTGLYISIYIAPLIIMYSGIVLFYKKIRTGFIKNEIIRQGYTKSIRKSILKSYFGVFVMLFFLSYIFFMAYLISGHFNYKESLLHQDAILINKNYHDNLNYYIFSYITNLLILSIYYINLGLIYIKKSFNLLFTLALAFLTHIIIDIFNSVVIGAFGEYLFGDSLPRGWTNSMSLNNFWVYDNVISLEFMRLYAIFLAVSSFIVVFIRFKNREGVLIDSERD